MADQPDLPLTPAPVVVTPAAPTPVAAAPAPVSEPKLAVITPTTPTTPLEPERPRVAEQPVAEPKPAEPAPAAADAPKGEEGPKAAADEPTLLEETAGKIVKDEPKPAEAAKKPEEVAAPKAAEAPKPEDGDGGVKPVEFQTVEYKYELPKNTALDDDQRGKLHTVLDDFRKDPAKNLQPLIDFHTDVVNKVVEQVRKGQDTTFLDTRRAWRKMIQGDAVLGGNGFETAKVVVAEGRDYFVSQHEPGTPEYDRDTREFDHLQKYTGAGDHPAFWRLLYNMAQFRRRVLARPGPTDIQPAPTGRAPRANGRNGSRMAALYDNPTSPVNKG